jgi:hypothetical protein
MDNSRHYIMPGISSWLPRSRCTATFRVRKYMIFMNHQSVEYLIDLYPNMTLVTSWLPRSRCTAPPACRACRAAIAIQPACSGRLTGFRPPPDGCSQCLTHVKQRGREILEGRGEMKTCAYIRPMCLENGRNACLILQFQQCVEALELVFASVQ